MKIDDTKLEELNCNFSNSNVNTSDSTKQLDQAK